MSDAEQQMKLTIDGREVAAAPGQTILQAALDAGIYIPYLCYYPNMKPYGACRTCVVEVESNGRKMIKASCTEPCAEGIVVDSKTAPAAELRRDVVELLMTEHPHGCLTCHRIELCGPQDVCQRHVAVTDRCTICPKNERCELKDTVRSVELDLKTPLQYHRRNLPIHADDPFYDRDYNLCIVCARCVRVCDEVRFDNAITMTSRSGVALVGTSHGVSLLESGCEFCGACIDVCPTGALVERDYKWEKATREVSTVCTNCPVGCRMVAEVNKFDKAIRFKGDLDGPANVGQACWKGKFGYDYPNHKMRLKRPLLRAGGKQEPTEWDAALDAVAAGLAACKPREAAFIASARMTNEDAYVMRRFAADAVGTPHRNSAAEQPHISQAMRQRLGRAHATAPIWDMERTQTLVLAAANPTEDQNVLAVPAKRIAREGRNIIVVDSRETEMTRYATEWLRVKPGTEPLLIAGMIKVIFEEALMDKQFLKDRIADSAQLRQAIHGFGVAKVSNDCGVDETALRRVTRQIANESPAAFIFGEDGLTRHQAKELAHGVVNMSILCGDLGRRGGGVYPLYQGVNQLGIEDMGFVPGEGGGDIQQTIAAIAGGKIKAAYLMADGLNLDAPQLAGLREALPKLDFLAVAAVFPSELTERADAVLPLTTYAEQDGTLTNLEGRVQRLQSLWKPRTEVRHNWQILTALADRRGAKELSFGEWGDVTAALAAEVPEYAAVPDGAGAKDGVLLRHADLREQPLELAPIEQKAILPPELGQGELLLVKGRVLHQPEPEPSVEQDEHGMNRVARTEQIHLHPSDASALKLEAGARIELMNGGAEPVARGVVALDSPHRGVISTTALFAELAAEMQDSEHPDPAPLLSRLEVVKVRIASNGTAPKAPKPAKPAAKAPKAAAKAPRAAKPKKPRKTA